MQVIVSNQAYTFLCSIIGGMLIAFIYDIFRVFRKTIKTRNILTHLQDMLFWIIASLVMFAVVYYSNDGEIRGYIFFGTILGIIIYILLLSRIVMVSSMFIMKIISNILRFIWLVVTYPIRIALKILSFPFNLIRKFLRRIYRRAKRAGKSKIGKAALWGRLINNIRKKI